MIANQLALVQREIWEHRSIWVTPSAVAVVVTLIAIAMVVMAAGFGEAVDIAIIGASNVGDTERRAALIGFLVGNTFVFLIAMWFLVVFYCLDALYAERKDKSILFWRSLPITDAETVISKMLTAFLVIPLATFAAVMVSHLLNLIVVSIWLSMEGGSPGHLIWGSVPLFDTWLAMLTVLIAVPIWLAPLLGWFLFVSAWTKRGPLLTAALPIAVLPILEFLVFKTWTLGEAILTRLRIETMPIYEYGFGDAFDKDQLRSMAVENLSLLSWLDYSRFLTSIEVWLGLVVCGLFATAAIYVRRYRDDS